VTVVERYLRAVWRIRATGESLEETSYYPALAELLGGIGHSLSPQVITVVNLKNRGGGIPDCGLFTPDQLLRSKPEQALLAQLPARGAVEAKGPKTTLKTLAASSQVRRYANKYRQVLVTNLREFGLITVADGGPPKLSETCSLANSEEAFWNLAHYPASLSADESTGLENYLRRVLARPAPIVDPESIAASLADYAKAARKLLDTAKLGQVAGIKTALEEALGLQFVGRRGEEFFRSSLVQTLFYGLFSAWVLWAREQPNDSPVRFDWRTAAWSLRVPMIRVLFEELTKPSSIGKLGLEELLAWAAEVLNRVDRAAFFSVFDQQHAVRYFYEPFLKVFDPELQRQLGVWYTPPEIVDYMVERVDRVLKTDLGLVDGLADERVYVLDPCTGTGSFLRSVLRRIQLTLMTKSADALVSAEIRQAAMTRIFGFEILPAPFVVAHLQLGTMLQDLGVALTDEDRVPIFLTNALTGWSPGGAHKQLQFPELNAERDAADEVKQSKRILVILGNPPYNAFAGVSTKEEEGLITPYLAELKSWGITKHSLHDLYVRFFRIAERRIAEQTGLGVVCFISNHSWLADPSFVSLRSHLNASFDKFWIDDLHGDRESSERAPDGRTSETIFASRGLSAGIRQGVAVSLWLKRGDPSTQHEVLYRDDFDAAKAADRRAQMLTALSQPDGDSDQRYRVVAPSVSNRFSFAPYGVSTHYDKWPRLSELPAIEPMLGLNENRLGALSALDKQELSLRMRSYFDAKVLLPDLAPGLRTPAANFDPDLVRKALLADSAFYEQNIVPFVSRPFDRRWAYLERHRGLWNRVRPDLLRQASPENEFLLARVHAPKQNDGAALYHSRALADQHVLHKDAYFIPFHLRRGATPEERQVEMNLEERSDRANLSVQARAYLSSLGLGDPDQGVDLASHIWLHALAIGYSPNYLTENSDGIHKDWPRIPLPSSAEILIASAKLGREVSVLLDDSAVGGPTSAALRPEPKTIGLVQREGGGALRPSDYEQTAGWGALGKGGIVTGGHGRLVRRDFSSAELSALHEDASLLAVDDGELVTLLGGGTYDVYFSRSAYWANVPVAVWNYSIGGYQVIKKWLSYREMTVLGRPLKLAEIRHVTEVARRLTALIVLTPRLDANYGAIKAATYQWDGMS
jgi:Type ISP C-terminal specificity domain/N-6 DNA Methylase